MRTSCEIDRLQLVATGFLFFLEPMQPQLNGLHNPLDRCHAPNWFSAVNMDKDSRRTL